jgi:hypothetical protein
LTKQWRITKDIERHQARQNMNFGRTPVLLSDLKPSFLNNAFRESSVCLVFNKTWFEESGFSPFVKNQHISAYG